MKLKRLIPLLASGLMFSAGCTSAHHGRPVMGVITGRATPCVGPASVPTNRPIRIALQEGQKQVATQVIYGAGRYRFSVASGAYTVMSDQGVPPAKANVTAGKTTVVNLIAACI